MPATLVSPYSLDPKQTWLKGNLHTHSTRSDGKLPPQEIIRRYAGLGHRFLAFADHDILADYAGLDACGMLLVPANEISSAGGPHLLDVGAKTWVRPDQDRQAAIDQINRESGFAVLSHPNWQDNYDHYTMRRLLELQGYRGVEIYNGGCLNGPGSPLAVDKWDQLLSAGRKVWGFANDDTHEPGEIGFAWNVAGVAELTVPALLEALHGGNFYASTGVDIEFIRAAGGALHVRAPQAEAISLLGNHGIRYGYVEAPDLKMDIRDLPTNYVRVECYGFAQKTAWSQPLFLHGGRTENRPGRLDKKPVLQVPRVDALSAGDRAFTSDRWARAPKSSPFCCAGGETLPAAQTEIRCLTDGRSLLFAVHCTEPEMDKLRVRVREPGDYRTGEDDSVVLFFDPEGRGEQCWSVTVNAGGMVYTERYNRPGPAPRLAAQIRRQPGNWNLVMEIPAVELGAVITPGAAWGFNACRKRKAVPETSLWSPGGFLPRLPWWFGTMEFLN
jgi:hypothetical protein